MKMTCTMAILALVACMGTASAAWLQKKDNNNEQVQQVETSTGIPTYFYGDQLGHCDMTRRGLVMSLELMISYGPKSGMSLATIGTPTITAIVIL